ncbi:hypothetical protein [Streptomyces sp. ISBFB 2968]|uniref:hypothetical protein n=1 Tax=Streptomyces sp. ISBFB 2968 TaxID=2903527 RepID=UPI002FDC1C37
MDEATKGTAVLAACCWLVVILASIDMACGNPTAINGVIGCAIPGAALTVAAIQLHRTR